MICGVETVWGSVLQFPQTNFCFFGTLAELEGEDAFINIKYMVPTYESAVLCGAAWRNLSRSAMHCAWVEEGIRGALSQA